mmetsp:Transcript_12214/g.49061  ORF Transcript_12214/g.49061 Transcript_12214/m.49061 type:complete len:201 (+) Transcript_12214:39-641(+)
MRPEMRLSEKAGSRSPSSQLVRTRALRLLELSKKRHEKRAALARTQCASRGEGELSKPAARSALKGLDPALLQRVREREQARKLAAAEAAAQGPAGLSRQQAALLPALCEHTRRLFRLHKRSVMLQSDLLPRLSGCTEPATPEAELLLLLGRLLELAPAWISRVTIKGQPYIKLRPLQKENEFAELKRSLRAQQAVVASS